MQCHGGAREGRPARRPTLEVADIFRIHGQEYLRAYAVSAEQKRVMDNIVACRTPVLGGYVDTCEQCGHKDNGCNSCGDRHCPKCQALSQAKWIEQRKARTLPTQYFHLVFTLPAQLRSLARCNRKALFNMLFAAAAETSAGQLGKPAAAGLGTGQGRQPGDDDARSDPGLPTPHASTATIPDGLPLAPLPDSGFSLMELEAEIIRRALDRHGGNKSRTAAYLGVPRHVLVYRIEKYGI